MTSLDDHVMVDNLEYATSIISRVGNLRKVLRELRNALREERLNLHQEIEMTILQKFIDLQRKYDSLAGYLFSPLCKYKNFSYIYVFLINLNGD